MDMIVDILIADDHTIVREGLKQILADHADLRVVAEAADGASTLDRVRHCKLDVAILDMSMPEPNGLDLIRRVKAEKPSLPVLVLSSNKEKHYTMRALKAGASGYLCKDGASDQLVDAIRKVAAGDVYISPEIAQFIVLDTVRADSKPPHTLLSEREYHVFERLVAGESVTKIADSLNISFKTVSTHKSRIMEKMDCHTVSDLVRYAVEYGLL